MTCRQRCYRLHYTHDVDGNIFVCRWGPSACQLWGHLFLGLNEESTQFLQNLIITLYYAVIIKSQIWGEHNPPLGFIEGCFFFFFFVRSWKAAWPWFERESSHWIALIPMFNERFFFANKYQTQFYHYLHFKKMNTLLTF